MTGILDIIRSHLLDDIWHKMEALAVINTECGGTGSRSRKESRTSSGQEQIPEISRILIQVFVLRRSFLLVTLMNILEQNERFQQRDSIIAFWWVFFFLFKCSFFSPTSFTTSAICKLALKKKKNYFGELFDLIFKYNFCLNYQKEQKYITRLLWTRIMIYHQKMYKIDRT